RRIPEGYRGHELLRRKPAERRGHRACMASGLEIPGPDVARGGGAGNPDAHRRRVLGVVRRVDARGERRDVEPLVPPTVEYVQPRVAVLVDRPAEIAAVVAQSDVLHVGV